MAKETITVAHTIHDKVGTLRTQEGDDIPVYETFYRCRCGKDSFLMAEEANLCLYHLYKKYGQIINMSALPISYGDTTTRL